MRKNCAAKTGEGDRTVEIVLKGVSHALAGKWPVMREHNSACDGQRQNYDAGDSEPTPVPPVWLPVLRRIGLFNDGCVTLGHCTQKSAKAGQ
jgi:hypothetical protein